MTRKFFKNSGFSIIEISIVLVVLGIILYSGLSLVSAQTDVTNIKETRKKIERIQEALDLFAATQNRLPCPANATQAPTDVGYGTEEKSDLTVATCTDSGTALSSQIIFDSGESYMGAVPTRTLNLPDSYALDAWGRKISYVVSPQCTYVGNAGVEVSAATTATGWASLHSDYFRNICYSRITVRSATSNEELTAGYSGAPDTDLSDGLARKAAYVLISHGKKSEGAWLKSGGNKTAAPTDNTRNDYENGRTNEANSSIFYDGPINDGEVLDKYFDDIVAWKTPGQIRYTGNGS